MTQKSEARKQPLMDFRVHPMTHQNCEDGSPEPSDRRVALRDGSGEPSAQVSFLIGSLKLSRLYRTCLGMTLVLLLGFMSFGAEDNNTAELVREIEDNLIAPCCWFRSPPMRISPGRRWRARSPISWRRPCRKRRAGRWCGSMPRPIPLRR